MRLGYPIVRINPQCKRSCIVGMGRVLKCDVYNLATLYIASDIIVTCI